MKIALSVQKGDVKCTVEPICRSVAPCLKKSDGPCNLFQAGSYRPAATEVKKTIFLYIKCINTI